MVDPARQIPLDNEQGGISVQLCLRNEQAAGNKTQQPARGMIFVIAAPGFQARIAFVHECDGQRGPFPAQHFDDRAGSRRVPDADHRDTGQHIGFYPLDKFFGRHNLDRNAFSVRRNDGIPALHETRVNADVAPALIVCDAPYLADTVNSAASGPSA